MSDSFNLLTTSWLPMKRRSGRTEYTKPCQITESLNSDPFVSFAWPRPDFNGASHELLIGLLSTSYIAKNDEDWHELWIDPPSPEELQDRLTHFQSAFDLCGSSARFFQDIDKLESAKPKQVSELLIASPGDQTIRQNTDHFVKRGQTPLLCRSAAAMALYTLNTYAPAGGAGHRTSLRGGGPLTTITTFNHRYGDTLWSRIWPNVETKEQVESRSGIEDSCELSSIFPWLAATRTSNPKQGGVQTTPSDVHPLQVYWAMPRRIRLEFSNHNERRCSLTGRSDTVTVEAYRTQNYGTNYSDTFEHPLSPYYSQKPGSTRLPVHPKPGRLSYKDWPGILVQSNDGTKFRAKVIQEALLRFDDLEHDHTRERMRISAFGFDMDNMKARAWVDTEQFLLVGDPKVNSLIADLVNMLVAGSEFASSTLVQAIKSAQYERPQDAKGDWSHISARLYQETDAPFHKSINHAYELLQSGTDELSDRTTVARQKWAITLRKVALRLFDEYAPSDGLEDRSMQRYAKANFNLLITLLGRGKSGKTFFESKLKISVTPKSEKGNTKEN